MIAPVLAYPGAKWRIASWIVSHLPPHQVYVEPYLGSGAVFFSKKPAVSSVLNDLDGQVVNLFRVLRNPTQAEQLSDLISLTPYARQEWLDAKEPSSDPVEQARRFLVQAWMSHGHKLFQTGWRHDGPEGALRGSTCASIWRKIPARILSVVEALRDAQIECRPAVDVIRRYNGPDVLIYADPPYLGSVRASSLYTNELRKDEDHLELLGALQEHQGPVVLSGYASELYEECLVGWHKLTVNSVAEHGERRKETLWVKTPSEKKQKVFAFQET